MLKDKIEKYIKELEESIELTNATQELTVQLAQHQVSLRLVISDLKFMLMEEL